MAKIIGSIIVEVLMVHMVMGVFMIGVPKRNDIYLKDSNDNFRFVFILHFCRCSGLLYTNR